MDEAADLRAALEVMREERDRAFAERDDARQALSEANDQNQQYRANNKQLARDSDLLMVKYEAVKVRSHLDRLVLHHEQVAVPGELFVVRAILLVLVVGLRKRLPRVVALGERAVALLAHDLQRRP